MVKVLLMMSDNIVRNMYSSQGTQNYSTQLHLVGYFRKNRFFTKANCNMLGYIHCWFITHIFTENNYFT